MQVLLLLLFLISTSCWAGSCRQSPFEPDPHHLARLESGLLGEWNRTFNESMISIEDWSRCSLIQRTKLNDLHELGF